MKLLTLSRTPQGTYTIVDNNDEKLAVVAETLRNKQLRHKIQELLEDLPTLINSYHPLESDTGKIKYAVLKETSDFVLIRVHDERLPVSESNPLQIDMNCEDYLDLMQDWEELIEEEPEQIFLKRDEDVFTLTSDQTDL